MLAWKVSIFFNMDVNWNINNWNTINYFCYIVYKTRKNVTSTQGKCNILL